MAVQAAPASRSLIGMAVDAVQSRARARGRSSRLAALAVKAREHLVTAAALASVDVGMWRWSSIAGLITLGVSIELLHYAVTGR